MKEENIIEELKRKVEEGTGYPGRGVGLVTGGR